MKRKTAWHGVSFYSLDSRGSVCEGLSTHTLHLTPTAPPVDGGPIEGKAHLFFSWAPLAKPWPPGALPRSWGDTDTVSVVVKREVRCFRHVLPRGDHAVDQDMLFPRITGGGSWREGALSFFAYAAAHVTQAQTRKWMDGWMDDYEPVLLSIYYNYSCVPLDVAEVPDNYK